MAPAGSKIVPLMVVREPAGQVTVQFGPWHVDCWHWRPWQGPVWTVVPAAPVMPYWFPKLNGEPPVPVPAAPVAPAAPLAVPAAPVIPIPAPAAPVAPL